MAQPTRPPARYPAAVGSGEPGDEDDLVAVDVDDDVPQELERLAAVVAVRAAQRPRAGASLGAGEIGSEHAGQASAPRASTWAPLRDQAPSSPTAEPPVRPSLTSGSPRSPWSGASSKPIDAK